MKTLNDSSCRAEHIYLDYNASTPLGPEFIRFPPRHRQPSA
jgi:hypothetical protein